MTSTAVISHLYKEVLCKLHVLLLNCVLLAHNQLDNKTWTFSFIFNFLVPESTLYLRIKIMR